MRGRRVRIALLRFRLSPYWALSPFPFVSAAVFAKLILTPDSRLSPGGELSVVSMLLISVGIGVVMGLAVLAWEMTRPSIPSDRARTAERRRIERRIAELERE